jgi:Ca2+-binding RTX toxin-like protein
MFLGPGRDTGVGGGGDDWIHGGPGKGVQLKGGAGDDRIWGGTGRDRVRGHGGDDAVIPGAAVDDVDTGNGRDRLILRDDGVSDEVACGPGIDLVEYLDAQDPLDVLAGCERVRVVIPPEPPPPGAAAPSGH